MSKTIHKWFILHQLLIELNMSIENPGDLPKKKTPEDLREDTNIETGPLPGDDKLIAALHACEDPNDVTQEMVDAYERSDEHFLGHVAHAFEVRDFNDAMKASGSNLTHEEYLNKRIADLVLPKIRAGEFINGAVANEVIRKASEKPDLPKEE